MFEKSQDSRFGNWSLKTRRQPWWVEIKTESPPCTYYFGPFRQKAEAQRSQWGYIEDLTLENVGDMQVDLLQGWPSQLTLEGIMS